MADPATDNSIGSATPVDSAGCRFIVFLPQSSDCSALLSLQHAVVLLPVQLTVVQCEGTNRLRGHRGSHGSDKKSVATTEGSGSRSFTRGPYTVILEKQAKAGQAAGLMSPLAPPKHQSEDMLAYFFPVAFVYSVLICSCWYRNAARWVRIWNAGIKVPVVFFWRASTYLGRTTAQLLNAGKMFVDLSVFVCLCANLYDDCVKAMSADDRRKVDMSSMSQKDKGGANILIIWTWCYSFPSRWFACSAYCLQCQLFRVTYLCG